jgi:hypothetical protein
MTSRVFFGWYVALAFSVMAFVSKGIRFAIGPFLRPMVADLDLDRGSFSLVIAVGRLSITIDERRLVPQLAPVAGGR